MAWPMRGRSKGATENNTWVRNGGNHETYILCRRHTRPNHADGAFPALPEELIKLIFEHACLPNASSVRTQTGDETRQSSNDSIAIEALLDVDTARSIALVSHAAHALVAPILYGTVSITRPSQLVHFAETLLRRPALGLLVSSLWIGNLQSAIKDISPPFVHLDATFAQSARAHLQRGEPATQETNGHQYERGQRNPYIEDIECPDFIYLERGCDYAAMHVSGPSHRIVEARRTFSTTGHAQDVEDILCDVESIASLDGEDDSPDHGRRQLMRPVYGLDKSVGIDAAGQWIGVDAWVLRAVELQFALEFHFEWVLLTARAATTQADVQQRAFWQGQDDTARQGDPEDWADAVHYPLPLPSEQDRRERELSQSSSSTAEDRRSNVSKFGLHHIDRFYKLRQKGYNPCDAARILLERQYSKQASKGAIMPPLDEICHINLLSDGSEFDDFLSPTLFARSGATHLLIHTVAPEGPHAPPDALPAHIAAASAHARHPRRRAARRGESEGSASDDSDGENDAGNVLVGRRAGMQSAVDFVDVFGHIDIRTRTLQRRALEESLNEAVQQMQTSNGVDGDDFGRTLRPEEDISDHPGAHRLQQHTSSEPFIDRVATDPAETLGSLTAKVRAILTFCPYLRVLGLNGFLERAIAGTRASVVLPKLRHLSLGPPPPYWSLPLQLDQSALTNLRSLHISGCMLYRSEVMAIGGFVPGALCKLRDFSWTLWVEHVQDHPITVIGALAYLLGADGGAFSRATSRNRNTTLATLHRNQGRGANAAADCTRPLRRIRVHLTEGDLTTWKQHAPTPLRDDVRLQLKTCHPDGASSFASVRKWWERKAGVS